MSFDPIEREVMADEFFVRQLEEYVRSRQEEGEGLTLDELVGWIKAHIWRGDIFSMLIQGLSGHGKTTLALKIAARFYAKGRRPGWKAALEHLFFDPLEITAAILRAVRQGKLLPLIIFDDAGAWLSKWAVTADKRFFLEFSNLMRMAVGAILYTDIYAINKYVRDTAKMRVVVRKIPRSLYQEYGIDPGDRREWSAARLYVTKLSIKGVAYKKLVDIVYPLDLPRYVRSAYSKRRREYTGRLAQRVILRFLSSRGAKRIFESGGGEALLEELAEIAGIEAAGDEE